MKYNLDKRREPCRSSFPCPSIDDQIEDQSKTIDTEKIARKITDPLIEAVRKELDKIDVTAFKK